MTRTPASTAASVILVLLAAASGPAAKDQIQVLVQETRRPEKRDPERLGFDRISRSVRMANLRLSYDAYVRPDQDDLPIQKKYGDHFFGCEFGRYRGNGGWDLWNFLRVTVADPQGNKHAIIGSQRQRGFFKMQEGARGVADVVWELPRGADGKSPGGLAIRAIKRPDWEQWFAVEVSLESAKGWCLAEIISSCYPYNTSKDPNAPRERWVATKLRDVQMTDQWTDLAPSAEWALMEYNHLSQEEAGCLLVCDPNEVSALAVSGTYAIRTRVTPRPGRTTCHFAFGYFAGQHYREAFAEFQAQAADILRFMRQIKWSVRPRDIFDPSLHREDFDYLAGLTALSSDLRARARSVSDELLALWGRDGDRRLPRADERRYQRLAREYRDLHRAMRAEWLKVLPPLRSSE